ncbi:PREDICTED: uncharacterized protein LOC104609220 [Nelumbo nucifera]|uniref:Uncharacterized protein LOC104609220 n=1 Tax=Nelumbo nucifera TaxID=4432 RepID=A0A1U8QAZ8_NELNU|nr:PREDICTED: uncharacterized protein LOC104609220 [Nelumbo nucifera]XP_019055276.1 PREDICTED: uncharacterized protein LOC104609220 [Nelumbo nucifera]
MWHPSLLQISHHCQNNTLFFKLYCRVTFYLSFELEATVVNLVSGAKPADVYSEIAARRMFGDEALGSMDIEVARKVGAASKFTKRWSCDCFLSRWMKLLEDACHKAGFIVQPEVVPSFLYDVDLKTLHQMTSCIFIENSGVDGVFFMLVLFTRVGHSFLTSMFFYLFNSNKLSCSSHQSLLYFFSMIISLN